MRNIKISVTQDAIAYARKHLWGSHPGEVVGLVQHQQTGRSDALVLANDYEYYRGRDGKLIERLTWGTIRARIAMAKYGAQGGRAGLGVKRPGVSAANTERWAKRREKKGGAL